MSAMLLLAGGRSQAVESFARRTNLDQSEREGLLAWLQRDKLASVEMRFGQQGEICETIRLTHKGEAVLMAALESTCELPEP